MLAPPMRDVERQQLEDRIAELEHALGLTAAVPAPGWDARLIGVLPPTARALLHMLIKRPFLSKEAVMIALYDGRRECHVPPAHGISVYLHQIRRRYLAELDIEIKNVWGKGWYIETEQRLYLAAHFGIEADR